jgi:hypothetical protein
MRARKRASFVVYKPKVFQKFIRCMTAESLRLLQLGFNQGQLFRKKLQFFTYPLDRLTNHETLSRQAWMHCPDVGLPVLSEEGAERFVENYVWPFALRYTSELMSIMTPFVRIQNHLISLVKNERRYGDLARFSSTFQIFPDWLWSNCEVNSLGVASEVDGVSTYESVFHWSADVSWSFESFLMERILLIVNTHRFCPIFVECIESPWFFALGITWGEFRDRCRQCVDRTVDVDGLSAFLRQTRLSWIPLFDHDSWISVSPDGSHLRPIATWPDPQSSFVKASPQPQPGLTRDTYTVFQDRTRERDKGPSAGPGGNAPSDSSDDEENAREVERADDGGDEGTMQLEGGDGQKHEAAEVGSESGNSLPVLLENLTLSKTDKAPDEARTQRRLSDVFPLSISGDFLVHAHALH